MSGIIVAIVLPPSQTTGSAKDKIRAIDYWGVLASSSAVLLLLIPISGGGTYFDWDSAMVISMLVIGSVALLMFVLIEWKFAMMPMMPLHLFKNSPVCAILIQNFLLGVVYYSHLYFLPIYYQNARLFTPIKSAALTIPFVIGQAISSVLSGQYISRTKRYGEVIWSGYALWVMGSGLTLLFNRSIQPWAIVLILLVEGMGVGFVFQPTLVAAQAHSSKEDRAVVISVRNFLRSLGGATGLALSSAVFSNVLAMKTTALPETIQKQILNSILRVPDLASLTSSQTEIVLDACASASRAVFTIWAPFMGVCLLLCLLIKDRGLQRPEEKEEESSASEVGADEKPKPQIRRGIREGHQPLPPAGIFLNGQLSSSQDCVTKE